jgi:hypothetical protein
MSVTDPPRLFDGGFQATPRILAWVDAPNHQAVPVFWRTVARFLGMTIVPGTVRKKVERPFASGTQCSV